MGSGFYLSPAAVAPFGNLAIIAWIVMGAGAICLGLTFAKLARLAPATGGPYAYTRMAYGDFAGFLIAWGYWISIWASLPVIAIAFAGAVFDLLPGLHNRTMAVVLTLGAIWAVVLVNLRGVKEAGMFSQITTYTKLIPFAAIALVGLFSLTHQTSASSTQAANHCSARARHSRRLRCLHFWGWSLPRFRRAMWWIQSARFHARLSSALPSRHCCTCSALLPLWA